MAIASTAFALQLIHGCLPSDIEPEDQPTFQTLVKSNILEEQEGLYRLSSLYRAGRLSISKEGRGYIEGHLKEQRDLLIEADNLGEAHQDDIVVAKRIIARRGRASGRVVAILTKAKHYELVYSYHDELGNFNTLHMRGGEPAHIEMEGMDIKAYKEGTVFLVELESHKVVEVLGNLADPKIDETISLLLHKRYDAFPKESVEETLKVETEVIKSQHPNRIDLTHLDFCTIDPITAKDFDDAIYFDTQAYTLYVAIADVSHYVPYYSAIDKEAKKRGFTTYFPHKSFPMLPRELSENICSLKPKVDRLAFVAKITLDKTTLKPTQEAFFEAIIHSKHRFNYDTVDEILKHGYSGESEAIQQILQWLLPLQKLTLQWRERRLRHGFDFRSEEVKLTLTKGHELKHTQVETGTPSHSLIEECMLLANQAAAKRFEPITNADGEQKGYGIFRIHEPPQLSRLEVLLSELATVGLYVEAYSDSPTLIRAIQTEAEKIGLSSEIDAMVIKSLRQASYAAINIGHFGLGFSHYSHFTSPIRRYSDLILHRMIKAQLLEDEKEMGYLLRNIESLCARVSDLEREATKAEWDFRDRKLTRWAATQIEQTFQAQIIEAGEEAKAQLICEVEGVIVRLNGEGLMLFDKVRVKIIEVNIPQTFIMGSLVAKLSKEMTEL
jgi:ribonuclease R